MAAVVVGTVMASAAEVAGRAELALEVLWKFGN